MPAIEELSEALLECLKEVSALLDHGVSVADAQQDALVRNDAEDIVLTSNSYYEVLRRLAQADERAAAVAERIAEAVGIDNKGDMESVLEALDSMYKPLMAAELSRISALAQRLKDANETNSTLLRNGMEIITTCLRIVAQEPEPAVYSNKANLAGANANTLSLDWRV
ncbi:MAG: flagellar export chaperone FlgN [Armatimonadota bacterium]|jgi:flagellar biosynthesis/type III secretory pathway chaperone